MKRAAIAFALTSLLTAAPLAAWTPCGGPAQRACCEVGATCQPGLVEVPGCDGDCECDPGSIFHSAGVCMPATPCGGEGQRSCCGAERPFKSCDDGLVERAGCSGNCTCFNGPHPAPSPGTCVKAEPPLIGEPATNAVQSSGRACSLSGYADLHMHLNTHLAHHGTVFAGEPAPVNAFGKFELSATENINTALSWRADELMHKHHGLDDAIGLGTGDTAAYPFGAPYFSSWPQWTSSTHQQVYYRWLERAWQGGLRLMVQMAISTEALCRSKLKEPALAHVCADSMTPIDRQLEATWDFQRFIDELCQRGETSCVGNEGWFRIVRTPLEAREAISRGQLAVVLGIEVDNLFNCKEGQACPNMRDSQGELIRNQLGEPIDTIARAVEYYYREKHVRHVFPVHNFDNAFGAAATWQDAIDVGNRVSEGRWWEVEDCGAEGYGFWLDSAESWFLGLFGLGIADPPLRTSGILEPGYASCNKFGMKLDHAAAHDGRGLGGELIQALMEHGMLIDVDHMSRRSVDDTLALTRAAPGGPYPLVAGHVQPFGIHQHELGGLSQVGRHERMRTPVQLQAIRADGGMVAAMTKDDLQDTDAANSKLSMALASPRYGDAVVDDCRHSSKSFAQSLEYLVDAMGAPVALGTDFNGAAGHVGPRFGDRACGETPLEQRAQLQASSRMSYPFDVPGFGTFEQQQTGYKAFDYNVDGLAHVGLLPDLLHDLRTVGLGQTYLDAVFRSAEWYVRVWERAEAVGKGEPMPSYGPDLSCDHVPLCLEETNKPPPISCPGPSTAECVAGGANVAYPDPVVGPDDCGETDFSCGPPAPGDFFALGSTSVACVATDTLGKQNGCSLSVQVVDTQAPSATAPEDLGGIECASHAGTAVEVGSGSASDVCEANPWLDNDAPALFPYGTTQVTWTASDSSGNAGYDAQLVTVVDTIPPSITCPERVTAECTGAHSAVAAPGSATGSDICDASLDFTQYGSRVFPLGDTALPYTATDDAGLSASCTGFVSIVDTTPPVIRSVLPTPVALRPPNHKLVSVSLAVDAFDVCDAGVREPLCAITDIESSEPEDGEGDGNTWMDWEITGALRANLRAERSGSGPGRTYTLEVTCADMAGLSTAATTTVTVPH